MTLPAYLKQSSAPRLAEQTIGNLGAGSPPYISIAGNRFTLIDAAGAEDPVTTLDPKTGMFYLDCVVIDALEVESKIYYDRPFDPSAISSAPPDCWSDNGIAPSRNASAPQAATCGSCPKAEWGSAVSKITGKGKPACGKYQKLAIMIPGDDVTFLLRVPPNSLGNLQKYLAKFVGQDTDMKDVLTRISLTKDTIGTLQFQALNYITEDHYKQRETVYKAKGTDLLIGRGDKPREGLLTAPAAVQIGSNVINTSAPAQTQTTEPMEPTRRRRRTRAEMEADAAKMQDPAQTTAPFRETQPNGGAAPFGITSGVAPNPELEQAIDSIFK